MLSFAASSGTRYWRGAVDESASNSENWVDDMGNPASAPANGDAIVLDAGSNPMTWDLNDTVPASWTQTADYTGTVTFQTGISRKANGTDKVAYGALAADGVTHVFKVTGDVTIEGGTWTHEANPTMKSTEDAWIDGKGIWRLIADIGGNLTVGPNAKIDVSDKGFRVKNGPGYVDASSGAHGAPGTRISWAYSAAGKDALPYGSTKRPCTLGSGGVQGVGGGAIVLTVGKKTTLEGKLLADVTAAVSYYNGAGGAILLKTGTIESTDDSVISARGGVIVSGSSVYGPGAGGRVAVVLTDPGADFASFSRKNVSALGNLCTDNWQHSPNGTVYFEMPPDNGNGELYVRGYDNKFQLGYGATVCDSSEAHFRRVTFSNKGEMNVANGTVVQVDEGLFCLDGTENRVYLQGGTLKGTGETLPVDGVSLYATLRRAGDGTVWFDSGTVAAGDGTGTVILSNATSIIDNQLTFECNLRLGGGAKIRHAEYPTVYAKYNGGAPDTSLNIPGLENGLDLRVNGDLTIDADAAINVDARGYPRATGPGKPVTADGDQGASHGGCSSGAGNKAAKVSAFPTTYGSIACPTNFGSGASNYAGGGKIRLVVSGTLAVDGKISSIGGYTEPPNGAAAGAGGSVWIDAGALMTPSGTGVITADGAKVGASGWYGGSGGGRVAVTLTKAGSDFDTYLNAGGKITACGSIATIGGVAKPYGGAGTVYLRLPGQGLHEGTLVIDNDGATKSPSHTLISSLVQDVEVGSVLLKGNAALAIDEGVDLSVSKDWTAEEGTAIVDLPGRVVFTGLGTSTIRGAATFANVACTVPGKTLAFGCGEDDLFKVLSTGSLTLNGDEDGQLSLASTSPGTQWKIVVEDGADVSLTRLNVSDSDASGGILLSADNSGDKDANNTNWSFVNSYYGQAITWTGTLGPNWGNAGNWDLGRLPLATDKVYIPTAANLPELTTDAEMLELHVANGMTLTVNGQATVTVALELGGQIFGSGRLVLNGATADIAGGTWDFARGTLEVNGNQDVTLAFGANASVGTLLLNRTGGTVTFPTSLGPKVFKASGSGAIAFADGIALTTDEFRANGVTLTGADWKLNVKNLAQVANVTASGSDASGGIAIHAGSSQAGSTQNRNWFFDGALCTWKPDAASTDFADPANWSGGAVPGAEDTVVIGAGATVKVSAEAAVRNLFVEGGAVTVSAPLAVGDSIEVLGGATLTLNRPTTVGGMVVVRSGATVNHGANADADLAKGVTNSLDLAVGGDMVVEPDVTFSVRGMGAPKGLGSGSGSAGSGSGAGHGGTGSDAGSPAMMRPCYDAIKRPRMVGSGYSGKGGGAVKLTVGGTLYLDSTIDAEGAHINAQYSGSGGSIWITCRKLVGSGDLDADGGRTHNNLWRGGGGRIAVWQTGTTGLDDYMGKMTTYGGQVDNGQGVLPNTIKASGGTVYLHDQDEPEDGGRLIIDYNNGTRTANGNYPDQLLRTDFPSTVCGDEGEKPFANLTIILKRGAALNLKADVTIGYLVVEQEAKADLKPVVRCNGYTLTVSGPTRKRVIADTLSKMTVSTSDTRYSNTAPKEVTTELGGEVYWKGPGLMLFVR